MGATKITVTIRNPAKPQLAWSGLFLVDTGAIDSLVPRDCLQLIGLESKAKRTYELADGSTIKMDITTADIEFMGEVVGGTIIFGEPGTEPILGVTALESVGIDVDPRNQKLKRMPATRLKKLQPILHSKLLNGRVLEGKSNYSNKVIVEIDKVKNKVPKWLNNLQQINTQILIQFLILQQKHNTVTYELLSKACQNLKTFKSNYSQMKNFGKKNNAKVFDQVDQTIVLWNPVKSFIEAEYYKIYKNQS